MVESHFDAIRKLPKKIVKRFKDCADIHLQQVDSVLKGHAGIVDEHIYARFKRREMYMDLISHCHVNDRSSNTRIITDLIACKLFEWGNFPENRNVEIFLIYLVAPDVVKYSLCIPEQCEIPA